MIYWVHCNRGARKSEAVDEISYTVRNRASKIINAPVDVQSLQYQCCQPKGIFQRKHESKLSQKMGSTKVRGINNPVVWDVNLQLFLDPMKTIHKIDRKRERKKIYSLQITGYCQITTGISNHSLKDGGKKILNDQGLNMQEGERHV